MTVGQFLPDLAPFVMAEDTDNVHKADEDGGVFTVLSGRLLADDSGDQPLCLFFGGPAFVCVPEGLKTRQHFVLALKKKKVTDLSIRSFSSIMYTMSFDKLIGFAFLVPVCDSLL